jgi:hypothetical protein
MTVIGEEGRSGPTCRAAFIVPDEPYRLAPLSTTLSRVGQGDQTRGSHWQVPEEGRQ